jgi:hypothetical protein
VAACVLSGVVTVGSLVLIGPGAVGVADKDKVEVLASIREHRNATAHGGVGGQVLALVTLLQWLGAPPEEVEDARRIGLEAQTDQVSQLIRARHWLCCSVSADSVHSARSLSPLTSSATVVTLRVRCCERLVLCGFGVLFVRVHCSPQIALQRDGAPDRALEGPARYSAYKAHHTPVSAVEHCVLWSPPRCSARPVSLSVPLGRLLTQSVVARGFWCKHFPTRERVSSIAWVTALDDYLRLDMALACVEVDALLSVGNKELLVAALGGGDDTGTVRFSQCCQVCVNCDE